MSLALHSRFVQRVRRRYPQWLDLLAPGAISLGSLQACYTALRGTGLDTGAGLRVLRQLVLERLVQQDCEHGATLGSVTATMTCLAEFALATAHEQAAQELDTRLGAPQAPDGSRARLWIVGMGKLGARELNVSSDIDLIYVYEHEGNTRGLANGRGVVSNHEYFALLVKAMYSLIGETTEHGFVFRVDLALRPNGNSGPAAVCLDALEEYFQVQGREWERFAWLKSRAVAPVQSTAHGAAQALRAVVLPFVFRRYLDYSAFDALRTLHAQIRSHAARRAAGRPERSNDVKLSRGGIREIEFTVQLLQVVRGGQFPELRTRPTLDALQRLARAGLMPQGTAQALTAAYVFLRRVEHRIQYLDDQQTHVLPVTDDDLLWIARALDCADSSAFLAQLDAHRETVAQEFDKLLARPDGEACTSCGSPAGVHEDLDALDWPRLTQGMDAAFVQRAQAWAAHPRVLALRDSSRQRLLALLQRTVHWATREPIDSASAPGLAADQRQAAALRWLDWMEALLRRESYLALLQERPTVHLRLLRLLGSARWPARYLLRHPGVIDELASDDMLQGRFEPVRFESELEERRASLRATGEDDDEALLNLLRRAHHAEVFRTLARDVEQRIGVEQVADDLSALADAVLRVTAAWCWQRLKQRHVETPLFAIIGYGKLGGKELGYGSDLDIVFVYDDAHENAAEVYAAFVRKLINWLSVKTGEGDLFEIDTALRPNGNSGLLVTSFDAFANYQQGRGSNAAWTWEHQAMTRARFVLGHEPMRARLEAVRDAVMCAPRDPTALRAEILAMRAKVRAAHPAARTNPGDAGSAMWDIKHGPGGMVDAEFALQTLVLAHAATHAELRPNLGNIALLQAAQRSGLLEPSVGFDAADAYRKLRQVQHQARLDERPTSVPAGQLRNEQAAISRLWQAVFKAAPKP